MKSIRRGDLYRLKRDEDAGDKGKPRPIVVVSHDAVNHGHSVLVVPFSSQQLEKREKLDYCAMFYRGEGGLDEDSVAMADQITYLDKNRLDLAGGRLGTFDKSQMERLAEALRWVLKLE